MPWRRSSKHGGTLDKFIGDAVMAFFGAPLPQADHAERAVRARSRSCCARSTRWNRERLEEAWTLQVRIAINSGPVVVGDIGSERRVDYTVLGNTVNVAARLEESARAGQIVIGARPLTRRSAHLFATEHRSATSSSRGCSRRDRAFRVVHRAGRPPGSVSSPSSCSSPATRASSWRPRRCSSLPLDAPRPRSPEIQSLDLEEVLRAQGGCRLAPPRRAGAGRGDLARARGLGGFPGPLVRWLLEAAGADGIARTAIALGDARARAVCLLAWTDGERTVIGRGETAGELVLPPRGGNGFGWDPVFQPAGETRTYGELADAEKDAIGHRGRAWRDLLARLGTPAA
jgi:hypothetical protein